MQSDALRGHVELLLLGALDSGATHGYALIERIRERSGDALRLTEGAAYPALHRLEAEGAVRSHWETVGGRRRRVYVLTAAGRRRLGEDRVAWRLFARCVDLVVEPA